MTNVLIKMPRFIHNKFFAFHIFLSKVNYLNAFWWGIKIGKGCEFAGKTYFFKTPNSIIEIEDECQFYSSFISNKIGINHNCTISTLEPNSYLKIGKYSGFSGVSIGCFEKIIIGNNVRVGANVLITDSDWHLDDPRVGSPKPVIINDNVWLGYGAVVLKGVTIGENTIIGANSVVVKDIPANVYAAGNPCRVIKNMN